MGFFNFIPKHSSQFLPLAYLLIAHFIYHLCAFRKITFVVRKAVEKVKRKIESNIEKTMQIWFHVAILDLNYKLFMASPHFLE